MDSNRNIQENQSKFNKRLKADEKLITSRYATAEKKLQLLTKNQLVFGETHRQKRVIPQKLAPQHQADLDRVFIEMGFPGIISVPDFVSPSSVTPVPAMVCTLDNNLHLCGAMGQPRLTLHYGGEELVDPEQHIINFDDIKIDDASKCYQLRVNCEFPFEEPSGPAFGWNYAAAYLVFDYIFPIGSSGTYCFMPLFNFSGTISYFASNSFPATFSVVVGFGVRQNSDLLGGAYSDMLSLSGTWLDINLHNEEQFPLTYDTSDFVNEGFGPVIVDLDSEHEIAKIPVRIGLNFRIPHGSFDGHFILDCSSYRGAGISCPYVKWGKKRPERIPEMGPQ